MSDEWGTYPRTIGDHQAWIVYNHGVNESIASLPYMNVAEIKLIFQDPDSYGLPTQEESAVLFAIEDELVEMIGSLPGLYVGRITVGGARHFFFYTSADADRIAEITKSVANRHDHDIASATKSDPLRESYWNELFPTDAERQLALDLRVEISLRQAGDKLERPRKVRHYAYFTSEADRAQFAASIGALFDSARHFESKNSLGVELEHVCCPDHSSISPFTVRLAHEAKQCNGEYDGWETAIVKE